MLDLTAFRRSWLHWLFSDITLDHIIYLHIRTGGYHFSFMRLSSVQKHPDLFVSIDLVILTQVKASLGINIVSSVTAVTGIVLHSFDLSSFANLYKTKLSSKCVQPWILYLVRKFRYAFSLCQYYMDSLKLCCILRASEAKENCKIILVWAISKWLKNIRLWDKFVIFKAWTWHVSHLSRAGQLESQQPCWFCACWSSSSPPISACSPTEPPALTASTQRWGTRVDVIMVFERSLLFSTMEDRRPCLSLKCVLHI